MKIAANSLRSIARSFVVMIYPKNLKEVQNKFHLDHLILNNVLKANQIPSINDASVQLVNLRI